MEKFINGTGLLNLVLFFGVCFFAYTYSKIFTQIAPPQNILDVIFQIITSLFFGILIFISIRKVENIYIKITFSGMEFFAILLFYLNVDKFFVVVFISFLASFGVFTLAYISTQIAKAKEEEETELLNTKNELLEVTKSFEQTTNELLKKQNELLKKQNECESVSSELLNTKNELLEVTIQNASLLSQNAVFVDLETLLQESRGEIDRLKEYEVRWNKKLAADKLRGERKNKILENQNF